jgi:hypothetical protein
MYTDWNERIFIKNTCEIDEHISTTKAVISPDLFTLINYGLVFMIHYKSQYSYLTFEFKTKDSKIDAFFLTVLAIKQVLAR